MTIQTRNFGHTPDGAPVELFTLGSEHGLEADIISYGGIIVAIRTPDRNGAVDDVTLGFDSLDGYLGKHPYFGATVGRYANRIANARFTLDGTTYHLAANDGDNALHGGTTGFDSVLWKADIVDDVTVRLRLLSPDGDEGYPGNLEVTLTYTMEDTALRIDLEAVTDRSTPVNLTNHSYFNLAGQGTGTILDHLLTLRADAYTPVGQDLIPTGDIAPVAGTPLDFRDPTAIGARIADVPGGYDHNYVLRDRGGDLALAARVVEPTSGRSLEVLTTEPGIQLYTGNFLDGTITGKDGMAYVKNAGFCLEPQRFPDSPNQPAFPSSILEPGETYRHTICFRFGIVEF